MVKVKSFLPQAIRMIDNSIKTHLIRNNQSINFQLSYARIKLRQNMNAHLINQLMWFRELSNINVIENWF